MNDLDEALALTTPKPVTATTTATGRRCRRHEWAAMRFEDATRDGLYCLRCGTAQDPMRSRRGRQSRNYGNRAELDVARRYGGVKVGHAGGPVDVRGKDFNTQVKTHRRLPPKEWRSAFAKMEASTDRLPRLLLRFVIGNGQPPEDYVVVPGRVWLDWFGRDEEAA